MSEAFVWTEKYSVQVEVLDDHHKKLFVLMKQLHVALLERRGKEVIGDVLDELLDYTKYHFGEEEKLMAQTGCPGLNAQKAAHAEFVSKLNEFKEKQEQGFGAFITTNVMVTLNDWLVTHIGRLDKLYSAPMNEAGIH